MIDVTEKSPVERVLFDIKNKGEEPQLLDVDGRFVLYLTWGSNAFHLLDLRTGDKILVGKRSSRGNSQSPLGPGGAISGDKLIWVDESDGTSATGHRYTAYLFDINTRKNQKLFQVAPLHEIEGLAFDGTHLVYTLTDVKDLLRGKGPVSSDVFLYDINTRKHTPLTSTGQASQPQLFWPHIV